MSQIEIKTESKRTVGKKNSKNDQMKRIFSKQKLSDFAILYSYMTSTLVNTHKYYIYKCIYNV